jgi:hypothetical protein
MTCLSDQAKIILFEKLRAFQSVMMMSKQMEEGRYYGEFYLNNSDWNQVNDFHIKLIRLLDGTRIRDLLSSIIEGER